MTRRADHGLPLLLRAVFLRPPSTTGLLAAVGGTGLVTSLTLVTDLEGKPGPPVLYVIVVFIATILGGIWSGLLASALAALGLLYFYLDPTGSLAISGTDDVLFIVGFVGAALVAAYALAWTQGRRLVAEDAEERMEQLVERERSARETAVRSALHVARMETLAIRLAQARSADEVRAVVRADAGEAVEASWASVELVDSDDLVELDEPVWSLDVDLLPPGVASEEVVAALPLPTESGGAVLLLGFAAGSSLDEGRRRTLQSAASTIATSLERVQLLERQRTIAETLQRSFLPQALPDVPGLAIDAVYLPATTGMHVGGDWYDAIEVADGRIALVVGDVVGHGLDAASTMGQIRNAVRVIVHEGHGPAATLERLNSVVTATGQGDMTTLVLAVVDPVTGTVEYSNAGHPPPLVVGCRSRPRYEEEGRSLPLGVVGDARYEEAAFVLPEDALLVLYTDGLIERRDSSLDVGLDRLAHVVSAARERRDFTLESVLSALDVVDDRDDDVAALSLHRRPIGSRLHIRFNAAPSAVVQARRALERYLAAARISPTERYEVLVAAGEAFVNAVEHAYGPAGGTVELEVERDGEDVLVTVRDFGRWRDGESERRSMGLLVANSVMDDVAVDSGAGGTEVRLRRKVAATPLA